MTKKLINATLSLTILLSLFGLIGYLFQVENIIQNNYLINKKQIGLKNIKENNSLLYDEQNKILSFKNDEERINSLDLVKVTNVKYIPISLSLLSGQTAKR